MSLDDDDPESQNAAGDRQQYHEFVDALAELAFGIWQITKSLDAEPAATRDETTSGDERDER